MHFVQCRFYLASMHTEQQRGTDFFTAKGNKNTLQNVLKGVSVKV